MAKSQYSQVVRDNLFAENQVLRQILGICSSLAVTNLMSNSLVMGIALTFVTGLSSFTLSLLRKAIPHRIRMLVQTLIIATYVIFVDIFLKAMLPEISKALGPYVGLIITNCIIMGRAEAFAQKNPPLLSLVDGLTAGLGYTWVLLAIAALRELLGFGTLFGYQILGDGFTHWTLMVMPPSAFFIIGALIWYFSNRALRRAEKKAAEKA